MVRLLGVQLPDEGRVEYALTLIYGVGWTNSTKILAQVKVDKNKRVKDLKEEEVKKIVEFIDKNYKVEGELREKLAGDLKRLREIGNYRGHRHTKNLPVRGQRTKSNARTKRGKRRTVGALRKETWAKLEQGKTGAAASPDAKAAPAKK